ncbi:hypothetical protein [Burkholderia sp. TSV86]|uniref:hypothetical protein n=1 Tax=Burkholderia sp. TSV86 TaxID=1385594 RepID=UPI0018D252E7|nr:hypothetical protein [Burkholderia sp. TSV86]
MSDVNQIRREIADRHRARLAELIRRHFDDTPAKFVRETGINQGELSGLLRNKSFGPIKARNLEGKAKLLPHSLEKDEGEPFYPHEIARQTKNERPESNSHPSPDRPTTIEIANQSARALIDEIIEADHSGLSTEVFDNLRATLKLFRSGVRRSGRIAVED